MKRIILYLLKLPAGKVWFQRMYEITFRLSLNGMNYGNGGEFKESGELNAMKYIKEKLKSEKDITLFDVGANVGNYSKALNELFGDSATIHSFEPSKKTFERLVQTTSAIPKIISNNFGLSDKEGSLLLYTDKEGSGLASLYQREIEHHGISMSQSEEIKLSTIDSYCKNGNINRIHFLKLDIEGNEFNALKGAAQMINNKKIDFIQFEFGGCNIDSRIYFKDFFFLLQDNYRIYRIVKDGVYEIPIYNETYEIFLNINYLAAKRN